MHISTADLITVFNSSGSIKRILTRYEFRDAHNIHPAPQKSIELVKIINECTERLKLSIQNNTTMTPFQKNAQMALCEPQAVRQAICEIFTNQHPNFTKDEFGNYINPLIFSLASFFQQSSLNIGCCRSEYELHVILLTLKVAIELSCLNVFDENSNAFKIAVPSYALQETYKSIDKVSKIIQFNLRVYDSIALQLYSAFAAYWEVDCKKNGANFAKKCADLFTPNNNSSLSPLTSLDDMIFSENTEDMRHFIQNFKLTPDIGNYTENLIAELPKIAQNINQSYGKLTQNKTRLNCFKEALLNADLTIQANGKNAFSLHACNYNDFIAKHQYAKDLRNLAKASRQALQERYPTPQNGQLCFNFINDNGIQMELASFFKKVPQYFKLKPISRTKIFNTRMLGHSTEYNEDRVDILEKITSADSEDTLLAIRLLWFQSDIFYSTLESIKHHYTGALHLMATSLEYPKGTVASISFLPFAFIFFGIKTGAFRLKLTLINISAITLNYISPSLHVELMLADLTTLIY